MENALSVLKEIMDNEYSAGRAGKVRQDNAGRFKEALEYILEAVREDSKMGNKESEFLNLGLWCGANVSFIQAEMDSPRSANESFLGSGATLYYYLVEYGWTPPPPK